MGCIFPRVHALLHAQRREKWAGLLNIAWPGCLPIEVTWSILVNHSTMFLANCTSLLLHPGTLPLVLPVTCLRNMPQEVSNSGCSVTVIKSLSQLRLATVTRCQPKVTTTSVRASPTAIETATRIGSMTITALVSMQHLPSFLLAWGHFPICQQYTNEACLFLVLCMVSARQAL